MTDAAPTPALPSHRATLMAFGGLLALAVGMHWGLWNNQWYQDDWLWLRIARDVAQSPLALFAPDGHNSEAVWRLTQRALMGLTWPLAATRPAAYHVASIVLHAVAATAVFRLLWVALARGGATRPLVWAGLGATIYVTSSTHAMAVQWTASQSTLLATIAVVSLLTTWLDRHDRLSEPATWWWLGGLFLLALYSKNTVVTVPLALAATIVLLPSAPPRRAWRLVGALAALAVAHLVWTKWLAPMTWDVAHSVTDQGQFTLSLVTGRNLLGAVLGAFVPARTYTDWGAPIPFEAMAIVLTGLLLSIARAVRVVRPVALGLIWIVAFAAATSLLDYVQYDPTQLTANRYQHLPAVGATLSLTFLAWGVGRRWGERKLVLGVLVALALLHAGLHRPAIQADQERLRKWGDAEKRFLDRILERAHASMPEGTTTYAVHWKTGDVYLACIDELVFAPQGYRLAGQADYEAFLARPALDPVRPPWVAFYDDQKGQFGLLPLVQYRRLEQGLPLSPAGE